MRERIIQLLDEFFGTRYVPSENLGLFICRVKRSAERLREVGHDLPPLYQFYQMIRSLPDDFRSTVQVIYRWSDKDFVPDKIEAELLLEENRLGFVKKDLEDDFPEDGDIFSAVGDRADHPEADSERDTRPCGAGSESQTGETHTLRPCASIPWIRKPVERKDRSRTDIYYFAEGSNVRLRSFNEVQKYCKDNNIDYDQNLFNFSAFGTIEVRLDDGVTFPAGWYVNRVWVSWMSTSSPQYRLGEGENVICQSAYLGDSGTGSTSFYPNCHRRCYCFLFVSTIM
ncbi:uncharacterized protein TNIN_65981 [Trichonephila inaurata madagascariensis]|uniref:MBD domain-containing protein n=1 Tax=Trichonephila inaurata madagascariensis TaxID=2747483 RepID=A0A8X6XUY3_9ARAC|nr:uncharacterized protein TNIN_65981 [Trichonephila inaurata madagascariensis]